MPVRPMRADETSAVISMMKDLWSDMDDTFPEGEQVFVWERDDGRLGGFISFSLRPWAEGCSSQPCPYIEGWYVAADLRKMGVGRDLVQAVEDWCRKNGHRELGSDVELHNEGSLRAHAALGFEPVQRVEFFRKRLL